MDVMGEDGAMATTVEIELFQPCSDRCCHGLHAVALFTELGASEAEIRQALAHLPIDALEEDLSLTNPDNEDLPDGWWLWVPTAAQNRWPWLGP